MSPCSLLHGGCRGLRLQDEVVGEPPPGPRAPVRRVAGSALRARHDQRGLDAERRVVGEVRAVGREELGDQRLVPLRRDPETIIDGSSTLTANALGRSPCSCMSHSLFTGPAGYTSTVLSHTSEEPWAAQTRAPPLRRIPAQRAAHLREEAGCLDPMLIYSAIRIDLYNGLIPPLPSTLPQKDPRRRLVYCTDTVCLICTVNVCLMLGVAALVRWPCVQRWFGPCPLGQWVGQACAQLCIGICPVLFAGRRPPTAGGSPQVGHRQLIITVLDSCQHVHSSEQALMRASDWLTRHFHPLAVPACSGGFCVYLRVCASLIQRSSALSIYDLMYP